jgi:hypothetical protein
MIVNPAFTGHNMHDFEERYCLKGKDLPACTYIFSTALQGTL